MIHIRVFKNITYEQELVERYKRISYQLLRREDFADKFKRLSCKQQYDVVSEYEIDFQ